VSTLNNTALLIIDVQNNILSGAKDIRGLAAAQALDAMVGRLADVLARARKLKIPIWHIQHNGKPDHRLAIGTQGWEIRHEVSPIAPERVLQKTACDAFYETGLATELRAAQITKIIIAGCMTQYCIDTSVRQAVSLGFNVILAQDGHTTEDTAELSFEQIIAYHAAVLSGIDAGEACVTLKVCDDLPVVIY
jgi:nicotinamidase-related amidase